MASRIVSAREHGLALISRINRWLIAFAIALSGAISVAAANAFHGRTRGHSHQAAAAGDATSQPPGFNGGGNGGLQPPAQAPAATPAPPGGVAVSGGS